MRSRVRNDSSCATCADVQRLGTRLLLVAGSAVLAACSSKYKELAITPTRGPTESPVTQMAGVTGAATKGAAGFPAQTGMPGTGGNPTLIVSGGRGSAGTPAADSSNEACASIAAEATARRLPSDIIWSIDTSGSMSSSFAAIQQALVDFSSEVVAAGIDAHIVLLAGTGLCVPPPLGSGMCGPPTVVPFPTPTAGPPMAAPDSHPPSFVHLNAQFGANDGMRTLLDSFSEYKAQLRPNARTQLVITEDGGPLVSADAVRAHIEGRQAATTAPAWAPPLLPDHYVWNGVVCSNGRGVAGCSDGFGAAPTTTMELIKATGGILGDLEQAGMPGQDPFGPLLKQLAQAVIEGSMLSCEYEIPAAPKGEMFDRDRVNVVYTAGQGQETTYPRFEALDKCADKPGWAYDDAAKPTRVLLCPEACKAVQDDATGRMRVAFGCATVIAVPD